MNIGIRQMSKLGALLASGLMLHGIACAGMNSSTVAYPQGESAICTSLAKAALNPARSVLPNNPIDRLGLMPAICSGGGMNQAEIPGGVRQLMQSGWRVIQLSHQVTPLGGVNADGNVELLISGVFVLERQLFTPR